MKNFINNHCLGASAVLCTSSIFVLALFPPVSASAYHPHASISFYIFQTLGIVALLLFLILSVSWLLFYITE